MYKKGLNDLDNQDGVVTHLEPGLLECEVKWALGRITKNIASEDDGIPAEQFKILNDDAVKMLHSICQHIWKSPQWSQDWKMSFFIPIPKNVQTLIPSYTFHMVARSCSKSLKLGFSSMRTENFQVYKLGLEKAKEPEIKLPTSFGS